jgi:hypothetical protein
MRDLTRPSVDFRPHARQAPPRGPRIVPSSTARQREWGLDRQSRRRNLRLMLLLLGTAPLSRQA